MVAKGYELWEKANVDMSTLTFHFKLSKTATLSFAR